MTSFQKKSHYDEVVCCDSCDIWFYVSFDLSLSDSLKMKLFDNTESSEDKWLCSACVNAISYSNMFVFEFQEYLT